MRHPLFRRRAMQAVRRSFEDDFGMTHAEIDWRVSRLDHRILDKAIEKANAEHPDVFPTAFAELDLPPEGAIELDLPALWQRIVAFFASPAGQFLLAILKALLLLLPFVLTPALTTGSGLSRGAWVVTCEPTTVTHEVRVAEAVSSFGDRPFRDAAHLLRTIRAFAAAKAVGNWTGPGGCLDVLLEFCETYDEGVDKTPSG